MLTNALIINGLVLFAVLESDLGPARKLSRFRVLRPLLLSAAIVPMFLQAIATQGTGLALEISGGVAGVLLGLAAASLIRIRRDPKTGRAVTRAGVAYAALWVTVIAARSCFSIGATHWFNHPLATWMVNHQVTGAAITDTLVIMAVAMTLTRTLSLAVRGSRVCRGTPDHRRHRLNHHWISPVSAGGLPRRSVRASEKCVDIAVVRTVDRPAVLTQQAAHGNAR